ncbi:MAG: domain S-box protein [Mucilaginibacter sp.]|nr:domain S-box protein [Mucilaginibacter sp.]
MGIFDRAALLISYSRPTLWNHEFTAPRPAWLNYFVPAVLTAAATVLKLSFFTANGAQVPFLLYFGVIMASASYGSTISAVAAVICCFFCTFFFFIYPFEGFNIPNLLLVHLVGFLAESLFFICLLDIIRLTNLKLKNSEERYKGIVEKSYEGFFMTDRDTNITYTCPSTSILLGYSTDELKQMHYDSLINPEAVSEFKINLAKLLTVNEASLKVQHQLKTKDGGWIWVETIAKNLLGDARIRSVVYHFTNITEKIIYERHQEDFVNIASHELKSPITALMGYMYILKRRLPENNPETLKIMARMDGQFTKLQVIISNMLDNTKIKAGEIQYIFTRFDLNECIKEAVDAVSLNIDSHKINCSFESPSRVIEGDSEKIGQVITNLVTNAIKYSPDGKAIDITTCIKDRCIEVKVTDYGIGIAKEKQKHVFERFYRVDTLPKKMQGLGLGLFISAEIIRRHNGKIGVESEDGRGSAFWFMLPLKAVPDSNI